MRLLIAIIVLFFFYSIVNGQSKRLDLGDTLPNYPLIKMVNYPTESAELHDFRGKLLILDYWFTGCAPCIKSWPKLLELQDQFGDQIQIILVNHMENRETVQNFISNRNAKTGMNFNLPSVTSDTILHRALPPSGYPTYVWIDENSVVKAFSRDGLNEENIRSFLNGKGVDIQSVVKKIKYFDYTRPMYINGNGNSKLMLWNSTVSSFSDQLGTQFLAHANDTSGYFITATNWDIHNLIKYAFNPDGPYFNSLVNRYPRLASSRIRFNVNDTIRLYGRILDQDIYQNRYTYQLISKVPVSMMQLKKKMQKDIEDYFGLEIKWEKLKKKCLVLNALDTSLISDFKDDQMPSIRRSAKGDIISFKDMSVEFFLSYLSKGKIYRDSPYPLVDETVFQGKIDLKLNIPNRFENYNEFLGDYRTLDNALGKYKMSFTLQTREIDVLMINDSKDYMNIKRTLTEEEESSYRELNKRILISKAKHEKNWEAYKNYFIDYVNEYALKDSYLLNEYAWEFYANKHIMDESSLGEALKWAKRSMVLNDDYAVNDTYAALLYKLGRKEDAMAAAQKALKLAVLEDADASITIELIKRIEMLD